MSRHGDRPRSRRELITGARKGALSAAEGQVVLKLLGLERVAARVYAEAGGSPDISPAGRSLAGRIGAQEHAHAAALAALLGKPAPAPTALSVPATEAALARHGLKVTFGSLRSERDWFTLLERLENHLEGAYYESLRHLSGGANATLAARILACEAQHATLLLSFRNPSDIALDVALSFVTGNAPKPAVAG